MKPHEAVVLRLRAARQTAALDAMTLRDDLIRQLSTVPAEDLPETTRQLQEVQALLKPLETVAVMDLIDDINMAKTMEDRLVIKLTTAQTWPDTFGDIYDDMFTFAWNLALVDWDVWRDVCLTEIEHELAIFSIGPVLRNIVDTGRLDHNEPLREHVRELVKKHTYAYNDDGE